MQLVVLGMHRSGTSAVTRLLNMMGAHFGPEGSSTGANDENPKGFWERRDVRQACDRLLHAGDRDWWRVRDFSIDDIPVEAVNQGVKDFGRIVGDMDSWRPWVMKEPRLCLLFPVLRRVLEFPVCVLVHRDPLEVATSLQKRNDYPLAFGLALWETYVCHSLEASQHLPRVLVSYNSLMAEPVDTVKALHEQLTGFEVQGLRVPSSREIESFVDSSLYRQRSMMSWEDHLNGSQAELAKALVDGSALERDAPVVSQGADAALEQFELFLSQSQLYSERAAEMQRLSEKVTDLEERNAEVGRLSDELAAMDRAVVQRDEAIVDRDAALIERDERLAALQQQLSDTEDKRRRAEQVAEDAARAEERLAHDLSGSRASLASAEHEIATVRRALGASESQRVAALERVAAAEAARRTTEQELGRLLDEAGAALVQREAHIEQLHELFQEVSHQAELLVNARTWRAARGLAKTYNALRFKRSRWNAPATIRRRLESVPPPLDPLPTLDRPAFALTAVPDALQIESAPLTTAGQPALLPTPADLAATEASHALAESALCATIAGRLRERVPLLRQRNAGEPTGWPLVSSDAVDPPSGTSVDVVVCVHNAPDDVLRCLRSLMHRTSRPFRLIIVDDGSERTTRDLLVDFASSWPGTVVLHNDHEPHGYTIAANIGLRASDAEFVVLLNSDTVVTYGWLERLLEAAYSDDRPGIVGPLSNAASHQSVPEVRAHGEWAVNELPAWLTADGMAFLVERLSNGATTTFPFLNGFCFGLRREVIESVGLFDEQNFAAGYGEESDYAQRARAAGFHLAVVDSAYVYHAKSRSYGGLEGRRALAKAHYQALLAKHGEENIQALVSSLESNEALVPLRQRLSDATASWESFQSHFAIVEASPLRLVFVIPGVSHGSSGGVHSIYQEVSGMRSLGIDAKVAAPKKAQPRAAAAYHDVDDVFVFFTDRDELSATIRGCDVVVATHHTTVEMVAALQSHHDFLAAYYIQDYEPFFADERSESSALALSSFTALDRPLLFAKTDWLCDTVTARHGVRVAKVEPSIDRQTYHPDAGQRNASRPKVVGMVRPRTPRRQPMATLRLLQRVQSEFGGDVDVEVFGCTDEDLAVIAPVSFSEFRNHGILTRSGVAALLASTDVFTDMSVYQAFGRTALEAMSCGATAVVPRLGGCTEFAVDGENALLVDTSDEDAAYEAVRGLLLDQSRLRHLQHNAVLTAQRYSVERAAMSEYAVLSYWHRRRVREQ